MINPNQHLEPAKSKRHYRALLLLLPALVFVLLLSAFLVAKNKRTPSPKQEAEFEPQFQSPELSRWATDSAVLGFESSLKELKARSDVAKVEETELLFPLIDFEVSFEE